jgi:hypothetical protein
MKEGMFLNERDYQENSVCIDIDWNLAIWKVIL